MSFVFCEFDKLKLQYTEFQESMQRLEEKMIADSEAVWAPLKFGWFALERTDQFGRTTWLPQHMADEAGDVLDSLHTNTQWGRNTFRQYFTSTSPAAATIPGWKTILQGGGVPIGVTPEDVRFAWAGLAFPNKSLYITKIRFEIGDKRFPIVDIEELHNYNKPALLFEEGFIIPEESHFLLRGWFETSGYQRVVPLGFEMYRRRDTVITE